ncbi:hypothetical protein BKA69DRAFT_1106611 [Paraphysoderma sedebokerense]|nr:hypothetical protein BKA69DRAFT_1106611 [Paraphysoderma sedebokerense]
MAACDQKCDSMLRQLRHEIRRNSKSESREEVTATVEVEPEVVVEKTQEREEASPDGDTIIFPLFYLPTSRKLPGSVNKLRRRETELLPMYKLTNPHCKSDTFIKVQLDDAIGPRPVGLVMIALFVVIPGVPIIVAVAQGNGLTMLYSIPTLVVMAVWYYFYTAITREREVLKRFSKTCRLITELSPKLFGKQVQVQMVKSVENKITGLTSNQLFRIKDEEDIEHSTAVVIFLCLAPCNIPETNFTDTSCIP